MLPYGLFDDERNEKRRLAERYEAARKVGSELLQLAFMRESDNLTPFLRVEEFTADLKYLSKASPLRTVTGEDILLAQEASVITAVQASQQVHEVFRFLDTQEKIRDDYTSIELLHAKLKQARELVMPVLDSWLANHHEQYHSLNLYKASLDPDNMTRDEARIIARQRLSHAPNFVRQFHLYVIECGIVDPLF